MINIVRQAINKWFDLQFSYCEIVGNPPHSFGIWDDTMYSNKMLVSFTNNSLQCTRQLANEYYQVFGDIRYLYFEEMIKSYIETKYGVEVDNVFIKYP